jgi:tRNA (mo5U34)-methyltransferase
MTMTKEEILSELERLQPWFHRIALGGGLYTKTESVMGEPVDHPAGPWETIGKCLPEDLSGKSVLDVGCNAGFYAIEAKRRGAARVLGVDGQRQHVRQAVFVRKVLGLDIEYRRMNVYELTRRNVGEFDITLALGLLYHLKHLVLALENLYEVTRELLVIETAIMPPERTPESFTHPLGAAEMRLHALAAVENPPEAKEQVFNWFLPGVEALRALLRNTGFDETEVVEVKNERAVIVCRKTEKRTHADVRHHYVAALALEAGPRACRAGEELTFTLRVENAGLARWSASGEGLGGRGAVHLGAHLLRADEEELAWDFGRADLPSDLEPGESARVELILRAPETSGDYVVEFDIVAEHVAWFEDFGSGTLRHALTVEKP